MERVTTEKVQTANVDANVFPLQGGTGEIEKLSGPDEAVWFLESGTTEKPA